MQSRAYIDTYVNVRLCMCSNVYMITVVKVMSINY